MSSYIRRTAFQFPTGWNSVRKPYIEMIGPKTAREWQRRAFNQLFGKPLTSIYGPPATGKGVFICMLAAESLRQDPNLKVIIAAPQKMITKDIKKQIFHLPSDNSLVEWAPVYLNDTKYNVDTNLELCKKFLCSPRIKGGISDGALVITHATLVNIFKNLKPLLKNVLIFFDEQHHIKYGESEDGSITETNELGNVVKYALDTPNSNIKICLTTATPYRGDKYPIIPKGKLAEFEEYEHPYDDAWPDFAPLENFGVDFILYKNRTYKNAIKELIGDKIEPCIIFIPNVNSRYSVGNKQKDVLECYKAISGVDKPKIKYDGAYTHVKKGDKWIHCIDLVDESNRDKKSLEISCDHELKDPMKRKIDVILALGMMKEGANWHWAKNEFIIGNRNSLREFVQMNGRLFRSSPDKTNVRTYYLLPHSKDVDSEEYEENFNDYMKATISSLLLIKVYAPRLIATQIENEEKDLEGNNRQKRVNYIDIELPDTEKQESLLEEARDAIIAVSEEFDEQMSITNGKINEEQREILKASLDRVLNEFGIENHREEVKEEIMKWFTLASKVSLLDTTGMSVKDIEYDMIKDLHPCLWAINYSSGTIGAKTFNEYRMAVEKSRAIWLEQFEEWKKYNKQKEIVV